MLRRHSLIDACLSTKTVASRIQRSVETGATKISNDHIDYIDHIDSISTPYQLYQPDPILSQEANIYIYIYIYKQLTNHTLLALTLRHYPFLIGVRRTAEHLSPKRLSIWSLLILVASCRDVFLMIFAVPQDVRCSSGCSSKGLPNMRRVSTAVSFCDMDGDGRHTSLVMFTDVFLYNRPVTEKQGTSGTAHCFNLSCFNDVFNYNF